MAAFSRFFSPRRNAARIRGLARRLKRQDRGVAAVEFAFILPIMLLTFFGLVEATQGVMVDRKVTLLNRTLADLTSQTPAVSDAERTNIFNAARTVVAPFPENAVGMTFSSVVIRANGSALVCWTENQGMTGLVAGSTITLPTGLNTPGTSLIIARSNYVYTPAVGYVLTGSFNIGNAPIYMRPRQGTRGGAENIEQVERNGRPLC
jgi:Flp pilus assembly protein TadG